MGVISEGLNMPTVHIKKLEALKEQKKHYRKKKTKLNLRSYLN